MQDPPPTDVDPNHDPSQVSRSSEPQGPGASRVITIGALVSAREADEDEGPQSSGEGATVGSVHLMVIGGVGGPRASTCSSGSVAGVVEAGNGNKNKHLTSSSGEADVLVALPAYLAAYACLPGCVLYCLVPGCVLYCLVPECVLYCLVPGCVLSCLVPGCVLYCLVPGCSLYFLVHECVMYCLLITEVCCTSGYLVCAIFAGGTLCLPASRLSDATATTLCLPASRLSDATATTRGGRFPNQGGKAWWG